MEETTLNINTLDLIHWFNSFRNISEQEKTKLLDAFWEGQIKSKSWLTNNLNQFVNKPSNVYIFGGWVGLLGNFLLGSSPNYSKIRSIDIDPWCEKIADTINQRWVQNDWKFKALTDDMYSYNYDWDLYPNIVINTITEHISQEIYDKWYDKIPNDSLIVIQGNDFFKHHEHIRCCSNLIDFKRSNHVSNIIFEGTLNFKEYNRFMVFFYK